MQETAKSELTTDNKNVKESLTSLQKILQSTKLGESLLTKTLLIEYKHLQKFCPSGVYILPQFDDMKKWDGVIFIREGAYKDGIFKFEIIIPSTYPAKPPEVIFLTKIVHPLIDSKTGKLDLTKKFPEWEPGKSFIVKVIYFIQEIFNNPNYVKEKQTKSSREESKNDFDLELKKYAKISYEERFENKLNTSLKFTPFNQYHQLILDKILKQNKEVSTYDRIEDFKNWFMNNFMEIIQNNENKTNNNFNSK